jgi:hypothetical protein
VSDIYIYVYIYLYVYICLYIMCGGGVEYIMKKGVSRKINNIYTLSIYIILFVNKYSIHCQYIVYTVNI